MENLENSAATVIDLDMKAVYALDESREWWTAKAGLLYRRHLRRAKLYRRCSLVRNADVRRYFRSKALTQIAQARHFFCLWNASKEMETVKADIEAAVNDANRPASG